jgi:Tfp pilus assembly protein FimV
VIDPNVLHPTSPHLHRSRPWVIARRPATAPVSPPRAHRPTAVAAAPPTGRPNYALRRLVAVLVVLAALAVAAAVGVGLLTGFGGEPASASGARSATAERTHLVQPGDTLWEIAVEHHGEVGLVSYLEALIDDNGGATIDPGQLIRLP